MGKNMDFGGFDSFMPLFPERTERLHAMLINCGHEKVTDHSYRWHGLHRGSRELAIWQYTLAGCGAMRLGNQVMAVEPGTALLGLVPEDHCYELPADSTEWEFVYVSVNGSELMRLMVELRRRRGAVSPFAPDNAGVAMARQLLEWCRAGAPGDRYRASALAYEFVMALLAEPDQSERAASDELVHRVHDYCVRNITRPIAVGELARHAGCSHWHFIRKFRQADGRTPGEFVTALRMRLAMRQLQSTVLSVKEIAANCGYNDAGYFCKVFRKAAGCSPEGFRMEGHPREK